MNIDLSNLTDISKELINTAKVYSPVYERNVRHVLNSGDYALRGIKVRQCITEGYFSSLFQIYLCC